MADATTKLERLEFTLMTRLSYWVILLAGLALIVDVTRILISTGELHFYRGLAGPVAVAFTLVVWRGRRKQVQALLPQALAGSDAAFSPEHLNERAYRKLAASFVRFGRRAMVKKLKGELAQRS